MEERLHMVTCEVEERSPESDESEVELSDPDEEYERLQEFEIALNDNR